MATRKTTRKPSKAQAGSLVERAEAALRRGINSGLYAPGQRLIETELGRELGISRGPIREAMRRLIADGLVQFQQNRGVTVRRLSRSEIEHLYRLRKFVESLGARWAAERIHEGNNKERLRELVESMRAVAASGEIARYLELNEQLHKLIAELSGNPWLMNVCEQLLMPTFRLQIGRMISTGQKGNSMKEHEGITRAILAGDGNRAEALMREHIDKSGRIFEDMPAHGI